MGDHRAFKEHGISGLTHIRGISRNARELKLCTWTDVIPLKLTFRY